MSDIVSICSTLAARSMYSPDLPKFRLQEHILVFNYFKKFRPDREYSKYLLPEKSHYLGKAYTAIDSYVMKQAKTDDVRVAFPSADTLAGPNWRPNFKAHIQGELYALTPEALLNMDRLVGNNFRYYRVEKFVRPREQAAPFKNDIRSSVKAFLYFGIEEFWENFNLVKSPNVKDVGKTDKWMWQ